MADGLLQACLCPKKLGDAAVILHINLSKPEEIPVYTCMQTYYVHACVHACIHICIHTHTYAYIHTQHNVAYCSRTWHDMI